MIKSIFLLPLILITVGCHKQDQDWPAKDDVYHTQIVMPPPCKHTVDHSKDKGTYWVADDPGCPPWAGLHFLDAETRRPLPQVCDTYGDGMTVCRAASFEKAPPVSVERDRVAKARKLREAEEPARQAHAALVERMKKDGRIPVYTRNAEGKSVECFVTQKQFDQIFGHNVKWDFSKGCPPASGELPPQGNLKDVKA